MNKKLGSTSNPYANQVLDNDVHEGAYQESSFYEDISNLSYIKELKKLDA
jgi:hypothetical protein